MVDVAVVMSLVKIAPVGGRASGGRERWRFEWLAEMRDNLADRRRFGDEGDEPDVSAAAGAHERKSLGDPRDELRPRDAGSVVGARTGIEGTLTPALSPMERQRGFVLRCRVATLAELADSQRRDGA